MFYKYGLTREQYEALADRQKNVCAICGNGTKGGRRLDVDHDHATGRVRELLCNGCNQGLGMFKEDVVRLEAAIQYLMKWKAI